MNLLHTSVSSDDGVGSRVVGSLKEPEQKTVYQAQGEVKPPMDAKVEASPQKAQTVVNVTPSEQAPKQEDYSDFVKNFEDIADQAKKSTSPEQLWVNLQSNLYHWFWCKNIPVSSRGSLHTKACFGLSPL